jgi:hypothetical protein
MRRLREVGIRVVAADIITCSTMSSQGGVLWPGFSICGHGLDAFDALGKLFGRAHPTQSAAARGKRGKRGLGELDDDEASEDPLLLLLLLLLLLFFFLLLLLPELLLVPGTTQVQPHESALARSHGVDVSPPSSTSSKIVEVPLPFLALSLLLLVVL